MSSMEKVEVEEIIKNSSLQGVIERLENILSRGPQFYKGNAKKVKK